MKTSISDVMQLNNGQIIIAVSINEKDKIVHGFNLASPHLHVKSFDSKTIRRFFNEKDKSAGLRAIKKALQPAWFYKLDTKSKHHSGKITFKRYQKILQLFFPNLHQPIEFKPRKVAVGTEK